MKILAVANAHALAHVSRLLEIAKILRRRGHEIVFAGCGKYLEVATWDRFTTRELPYTSVEQIVAAVRSQKLWQLYPERQLETFIEAELALYQQERPDLVLIDNRPTARTSAEKARLPIAAVLNVQMSNYRRIPFFSIGDHGVPGTQTLDYLENLSECLLYDRLVMGGLNHLRHRLRLPRLYAYEHEEGERSLLADIPEFNPVRALPAHARYIGPLTWHNDLPPPACLEQLDRDRPTVYLSLGSEGLDELVERLDALTRWGIQVVVAAGAAALNDNPRPLPGIFIERYVNTDALLPHCDLVCCHGGNGTLYQALAYGLPIVVVATHAEQHYGGKQVQRLGFGRALTLKKVRRRGLDIVVDAIRHVLVNDHYRQAAQAFRKRLKSWDGAAAMAAQHIEHHLISRRRAASSLRIAPRV
ncbi:MAG TPA: nucleotide disphospho-sugar-binding domain-containing protein [Nitrococcus sp.]|nr:nucleotide disphospho-sugar-binding domain-containing protein [Nitrococcus sp.]